MKIEQKVKIFDEKLIKLTKKTKKFFLSTSLRSALFYFATYMKKKTLTLLALTALFLTGCNTGKTSESETNPKSDTASEKEAIPEDTAKATEAPATDVSEAPKETATATQGGSAT